MDAEVEFDGGDDGAEEGDDTGHGGNDILCHVGLESDGGDGVDAAEDDEGEFKVLGVSSVFPISFFVIITIYDTIFSNIIEELHELGAPLCECRVHFIHM